MKSSSTEHLCVRLPDTSIVLYLLVTRDMNKENPLCTGALEEVAVNIFLIFPSVQKSEGTREVLENSSGGSCGLVLFISNIKTSTYT